MRTTKPYILGFTLIETLIVICLLATFIDFAFVSGIEMFDRGLSRTDRTLLPAALREARAEAMNGTCSLPTCTQPSAHGVFVSSNQAIIFEGTSYASRYVPADVIVPFSAEETVSHEPGMVFEIVFAPGSGDLVSSSSSSPFFATSTLSVSIAGSDHQTEIIHVNAAGAISAFPSP